MCSASEWPTARARERTLRSSQDRLTEDLARLVDHLALFAVQPIAFVAADLGDQVLVDLVRVDLGSMGAA